MRTYLVIALAWICLFQTAHARQSCDWPFRTSITINEITGLTSSDYQVKLTLTGGNGGTLNSAYNWSSDGADLRVYASDDTSPLSFSIASWNAITEIAEVWVTLPTLPANGSEIIYVYYGNSSAGSADSGMAPTTSYVNDRIKFHTRSTTADPTSYADAKALFDGLSDNVSGYQCSHPTIFDNITNANQGGNSNNFIAYSEALFTVPTSGTWGVRYGADYGLGGGLYVNGVALDERWNDDLWWNNDWGDPDVLSGFITLSAGEHKLEIIGAEGCCDGGLTIQFYNGATGTWGTNLDLGIDVRSQSCPVNRHTISYGSHDVCYTDLALTSADDLNPNVIAGGDFSTNITVNNLSTTSNAPSTTTIQTTLPTNINYVNFTGTGWNCSLNGSDLTCTYSNTILLGNSATPLQLEFDNQGSEGDSQTLTYTVNGSLPDNVTGNNTLTYNISVLSNSGIPASCSNPKPGILVSFYDISGYPESDISTQARYQALVDARANGTYLQGQTIFTNINGSGNPFSSTEDEFLAIFNGYIYTTTNYNQSRFGVDGDDSIEAIIGGSDYVHYYGLHGPANSAQDVQRVRLSAGFTSIEFRIQEYTGGDAYTLYWDDNQWGSPRVVPSNMFYHCAGDPDIQVQSQLTVENDPINGTSNPKAIPGAILTQLVTVTNQGQISTDMNTTNLTQVIASNNSLYVSDFISSGPIEFTDQASPNHSGLSYQFIGLGDNADSISFSNDNGSTFNYTPTPDADGYDANVTHFRLNLSGSFRPVYDGTLPSFQFSYQLKVE